MTVRQQALAHRLVLEVQASPKYTFRFACFNLCDCYVLAVKIELNNPFFSKL